MRGLKFPSNVIFLIFLTMLAAAVSGAVPPTTGPIQDADIASFHSIDNASMAVYEGQNALQNGRYEEAVTQFTIASQLDPSWLAAWYLKAYSLQKLNRSEEALSTIDQALVLDPSDRDSNNLKADILEAMGRPAEAARFRVRVTSLPSPSTPVPAATPHKSSLDPVIWLSGVLAIAYIARREGRKK
jgi:tetratricopeptide (TPR) repeat protein